jgi:L-malate glycosyltransferase
MDHFDFPHAGTEGQLYALIKDLDPDLYAPILCLFRYTSDYFEKNNFPCPVFSIQVNSFYHPATYLRLWRLRRYVQKHQIDIVQTIFNETALVIPPLLRGTGAKIVSTRRDMGIWYTPLRLRILKTVARFVDRYLVNSESVKEHTRKMEGVPEGKVKTIHNAVYWDRFAQERDEKWLEKLAIPRGARIIGFVGNMRPVKRVDDLISALPLLLSEFPDSYLVVAGHGDEKTIKTYRALAETLGVAKRIRFLGNVAEVIPLIKLFTVAVNCSDSEGLSNAVIEYMACEIPVVATSVGGNRDLVEDGRTGLRVPPRDPKALAQKIGLLLRDPELGRKLAVQARQAIAQNFQEGEILRQYGDFYQALCSEGTAGRTLGGSS